MLLTNCVRTVHSGDYKAEVLIVRTEKTRDPVILPTQMVIKRFFTELKMSDKRKK